MAESEATLKTITQLFITTLILSLPAYGQQPTSRFATIHIEDDDQFTHRLLLNDKEVLKYDGLSIHVFDVLRAKGVDYLIVGTYTGGIACPVELRIVEVYKSGEYKLSEEIDSCAEPDAVRLVNGRVVIENLSYIPHPELMSKRELRRRERTKEIYTWSSGTLTKSGSPRYVFRSA